MSRGCWLTFLQLVRETTNILQVKVTSERVLDMFDLLELIESFFHRILCFKHCNKTDLLRHFVVIEPDVVNQFYLSDFVTISKRAFQFASPFWTSVSFLTDPMKGDAPIHPQWGPETPNTSQEAVGKPYASKSQIVLMDEASLSSCTSEKMDKTPWWCGKLPIPPWRGYMGVSKNRGTPKWMGKMETPIKMDDLGVPLFSETPV